MDELILEDILVCIPTSVEIPDIFCLLPHVQHTSIGVALIERLGRTV